MAYKEQEVNVGALEIGSGGGRDYVNHKIKDGDNIFRILPPFGTKANGRPMAEYWLSWGFTDKEGNKKPLVSTLGIDGECPIFDATKELTADMNDAVREFSYEEDGRTKIDYDKIPKELLQKYNELKANRDAIRPQRGFFYNAMDQTGTVGILRLPKTAAEQLNAKIKDSIQRLGFNPLSLREGCSFNIRRNRTGKKAYEVKYEVDLVKTPGQDANGNPTEVIQKSSVPQDLIDNFEERAYDLFNLYKYRTPEELRAILSGDTSIFDREAAEAKSKSKVSGNVVNSPKSDTIKTTDSSEISVGTETPATTPTETVATKTETPVETPVEEKTTKLTEESSGGDDKVAELARKLNF